MINDLKEILQKNEIDKLENNSTNDGMGITASSHKISHIEDIIRKLSPELREEFNQNGQNEQLKFLIEQFRAQKREMESYDSFKLQEKDLAMFDQNKGKNRLLSTMKSDRQAQDSENLKRTYNYQQEKELSSQSAGFSIENKLAHSRKEEIYNTSKEEFQNTAEYTNERANTIEPDNSENISKER